MLTLVSQCKLLYAAILFLQYSEVLPPLEKKVYIFACSYFIFSGLYSQPLNKSLYTIDYNGYTISCESRKYVSDLF